MSCVDAPKFDLDVPTSGVGKVNVVDLVQMHQCLLLVWWRFFHLVLMHRDRSLVAQLSLAPTYASMSAVVLI